MTAWLFDRASLRSLIKTAEERAEKFASTGGPIRAVAFVDLTASTAAKLASGALTASRGSLTFTEFASKVVAAYGGVPVKALGDGLLATFIDPLAACLAMLQIREGVAELNDKEIRVGITVGHPVDVVLDGTREDVLGDVVDRAARLQSVAFPGQVVIDDPMYQLVRAELAENPDIRVDPQPRSVHARGIGRLDVRELVLANKWKPQGHLATPFLIDSEGRAPLEQKLAMIHNAQTEIVEIGIGLTSFAQYFEGQRPNEFRDPIRELIRGGVMVRCYAMDWTYRPGVDWYAEQDDPSYAQQAAEAKRRILREAQHCKRELYRGQMEYYSYQRVPEFWCLGVDVDDPVNGSMFFAPYLMDVARSAAPYIQVSRLTEPMLFDKYLTSIKAVRRASRKAGLAELD